MKTDKLASNMKNIFVGVSTLVIIFFLSSCKTKIPFSTSTFVPAAEGYATVKADKNMNYEIKISISNLAEVDRLIPLANIYVAWIVTEQDSTKNIGGLVTSINDNVTLKTVSSFKPVQIIITAEEDANIPNPAGQIVLATEKF